MKKNLLEVYEKRQQAKSAGKRNKTFLIQHLKGLRGKERKKMKHLRLNPIQLEFIKENR